MATAEEQTDGVTSESNQDAMALILQQAGKSAAEVAALSTLDDADQTAENRVSRSRRQCRVRCRELGSVRCHG